MAASKRIAWDACAWIALILREKITDAKGVVTEDRGALARTVIEAAAKGKCEIVVSGLCLAEVCKNPPGAGSDDKVGAFFEQDFVLIAPVDTVVGTKARQLMMSGRAKLKPPDAVHLATALVTDVDELHTFDDRLLALDGQLAKNNGDKLKICKPDFGTEAPLLDLISAAGAVADAAVAAAKDEKAKDDVPKAEPDPKEAAKPAVGAQAEAAKPEPDPEVSGDGKDAGVQPERRDVRPAVIGAGPSEAVFDKKPEEVAQAAPPAAEADKQMPPAAPPPPPEAPKPQNG